MKKNKFILILFAMVLLCGLTSCGCNKDTSLKYSSAETELKETQLQSVVTHTSNELKSLNLTDEEINEKINLIRTNFNASNTKEVLTTTFTNLIEETNLTSKVNDIYLLIVEDVKIKATSLLTKFYNLDDLKTHSKELVLRVVAQTEAELINATEIESNIESTEKVENSTNVYQIIANHALNIAEAKTQYSPIRWYKAKQDGFFSMLFNNFLVFPIGWLLQAISRVFGGYYIIGLLIVTLLIRTVMMPVYNSTNNMSLKMQLMQPDLQKLEAKYANKNDQESQQAKQMEQMRIYKKYKMGFGGCFSMLLQFPVFMGVYQAVSRLQLTDGTICNSPDWVNGLKTKFLGVDLFLTRGEAWSGQFWGIIVVLILVVGTQFLQQILTQRIQKATYAKSQQNIPEYRRQAMQQNQNNGSMKFMMYFMILMMGVFVFQSAAGLGIYWLIGNLYSLIQMIFNYKNSDKKLEKLKKKLGIEE